MLNPEQFTAVHKANIEALLGLGTKAFEGVEQLTALNLQVAKASLGEAADTTLAALSVKDAQSLLALQAGSLQPLADKAAAYSRQVYDILSATKSEFEKASAESVAEAQALIAAAFDSAAKQGPAGSENGIALWKSAIATANSAFESMQKAVQQATDVAEANVAAATASVTKPAKSRRTATA